MCACVCCSLVKLSCLCLPLRTFWGAAAGFENPMYSFSGEATTSDESAESAGGYMDVQAGGDEEF